MKVLILVKCLRLCRVLIRLPCLRSAFPSHKQFQVAVVPRPVVTDLLYLPLFLAGVVNDWGGCPRVIIQLPRPTSRGVGGLKVGVIPHLNGPVRPGKCSAIAVQDSPSSFS